jgi:hypothetical protein
VTSGDVEAPIFKPRTVEPAPSGAGKSRACIPDAALRRGDRSLRKAARRSDDPEIETLFAAALAAASRDDEGRQPATLELSELLEQFPAEWDRQLATPAWK